MNGNIVCLCAHICECKWGVMCLCVCVRVRVRVCVLSAGRAVRVHRCKRYPFNFQFIAPFTQQRRPRRPTDTRVTPLVCGHRPKDTHTHTHHCFKRPLQRHPDASGKCCALLFSICNHSAWFTIFCLLPCVKCCARVYQIWRRRHMFEFKKGRQSENCPSMWSQHVSSSLTPTTPASSLALSPSLGLLPS